MNTNDRGSGIPTPSSITKRIELEARKMRNSNKGEIECVVHF
jgi:hypothetical protein